ncbi:glutathionylspermidine synthase [Apiospora saccharicola]|uniref:Glutathionylspermidine synthase n=1 Tax=Apiospora saccharicola TaxID=335842 RepID=A0ABR1WEM7_9PEZI
MRRIQVEKRPNVTRLVQSQGLVYSFEPSCPLSSSAAAPAPDGEDPYWPDNRYYSFTSPEIALLEEAGQDVFAMCCEAADYLVAHPDIVTGQMAIPAFCLQQIAASWNRAPAWGSVYGRFDICFGGLDHPDPRLRTPKFYEFNADTPMSLVEAATIQWQWLEQTGHGHDQFNSLSERLVAAWRRNLGLIEENSLDGHKLGVVHFACSRGEASGEDAMNTTLLMATCEQAGYRAEPLFMDQIGRSRHDGRFYDHRGRHLDVVFKLYPWEWMVEQPFGEACFRDMGRNHNPSLLLGDDNSYTRGGGTVWIEAPYKMLWSNKGLFAVLWRLFRDDPRSKWLLPTYFEGEAPASLTRYARKPLLAREGADVTLHLDGEVLDNTPTGQYGKEGYVVQELAVLPGFRDGLETGLPQTSEEKEKGEGESEELDAPVTTYYPVLGLWFVDGEPAGMGIREDTRRITANKSWFIPHSISDGPVTYERKPIPDAAEIEALLTLENYPTLTSESNGVLGYIEGIVRD